MSLTIAEIREAAEADLEVFIRLVAPYLELGECHIELIRWWTSSTRKDNCLLLLPRGHLKSKLLALKTAWEITREPDSTTLYLSATAALAQKQLFLIKNILTSPIYRRYWPEMVMQDEAKREKWTAEEISVDHPKRKAEGVRDATVKAAGLTTNITGFHATKIKLDDIVVPKNAYTEDGRQKVAAQVSQIASIKEPNSTTDCVGTRYHPKDQYDIFLNQKYVVYDDDTGEPCGEEMVWDSYTKVVEVAGNFLWPRKRRSDGKSFGFDQHVLSKIKAEYEDTAQFYAQYYNNPNDPGNAPIDRARFQYYDQRFLTNVNDRWTYNGAPLNVYAGLDFAYSLSRKADFTALVVIGIDADHNIYVLDIERFKTAGRVKDYFAAVERAYRKWGFKKIRCEVTAAQSVIVRDMKENYIGPLGLHLVVDEYRPSRNEGTKEERINATLQPKYDNSRVWHYKGGDIQALEEELTLAKPPHDDIKDGLTAAIDIAVAPMQRRASKERSSNVIFHSRFGGVSA